MLFYKLLLLPCLVTVHAHTWLLTPNSRHQNPCTSPLVKPSDGNCCAKRPAIVDSKYTYTRGQVVETTWGKNNHVGGFIRYAIVPIEDSDTFNAFSDSTIFQYTCYAPNCVGQYNNFFQTDPPGTPFNGIKCSMNIKIPDWLPDGMYTIQWRWHSGGDTNGKRNLGLIDYTSCLDLHISGGPLNPKPACPLFVGGDQSNPFTNSCEFFKWNDIDTCTRANDGDMDNNNCFSWYAQAPPKPILECPSNILPGGMTEALKGNFAKGEPLPLFIGETKHFLKNTGDIYVDLDKIRAQAVEPPASTPASTPVSTSTTPASTPASTPVSTSTTPASTPVPTADKTIKCILKQVLKYDFNRGKRFKRNLLCRKCQVACES